VNPGRALRREAGFTLVEVLVALVIVAFGMGALLAALTSSADTATRLRDKSFAEWIALNRISELRLRDQPPPTGDASGDIEYAGGRWRWTQRVEAMEFAELVRIDVSVAQIDANGEPGDALAQATGFYARALRPGNDAEPSNDWTVEELARQSAPPPGADDQDGNPAPRPSRPLNNPGSRN
jgi:general secretion pathway protein I